MIEQMGCDAHKRYSIFVGLDERARSTSASRVEHTREEMRAYLQKLPQGTPIAIESVGNWYWIIEEMEKAGHHPLLTNAGKAKKMMGQINKTDKLDARGLAVLLRNGTLPSVWIPPAELRDHRELPRTRMVIARIRTRLKNRIQSALAKYNIQVECSDIFGKQGRIQLNERLTEFPPETRRTVEQQLSLLDEVEKRLEKMEEWIQQVVKENREMQLLKSLPGVGYILSVVIALELGSVERFGGPGSLANYAGTVPRIHESGGKIFLGRVRPDVNRYLKWALVEAANVAVLNQKRWVGRHVVSLYQRVRERRGHPKAVVAVARHLAEACYWMLKKNEFYREPGSQKTVSSTQK